MEKLVLIGPLVFAAGTLSFLYALVRSRMLAAEDRRGAEGGPSVTSPGEAFVGRNHWRRGFAHLTATATEIRLVAAWRRYVFPRNTIERLGPWNPLWGGLVIKHTNAEYPPLVVFVPLNSPRLWEEIRALGYVVESDYLRD